MVIIIIIILSHRDRPWLVKFCRISNIYILFKWRWTFGKYQKNQRHFRWQSSWILARGSFHPQNILIVWPRWRQSHSRTPPNDSAMARPDDRRSKTKSMWISVDATSFPIPDGPVSWSAIHWTRFCVLWTEIGRMPMNLPELLFVPFWWCRCLDLLILSP